jgi:hypothetical protein
LIGQEGKKLPLLMYKNMRPASVLLGGAVFSSAENGIDKSTDNAGRE